MHAQLRRVRTLLGLKAVAQEPEHVRTHVLVYDIDGIQKSVAALHRTFPSHFLHTFAVKAATALPVLRILVGFGMGLEAASVGELKLALCACPVDRIVFDCPAKTADDLAFALEHGVFTNLDNFQELAITEALVADHPHWPRPRVGLRINPQLGIGDPAFAGYATVSATSKFGIPLRAPDNRSSVIDAFVRNDWLTGLHCHAGSQGVPLSLAATAQRTLCDLAREVVKAGGTVDTIDVGGGLSVNFGGGVAAGVPSEALRDCAFADEPRFADAAAILQGAVPELFTCSPHVDAAGAGDAGGSDGVVPWVPRKVVTEYGRTLLAKHGVLVSRIIGDKWCGGPQVSASGAKREGDTAGGLSAEGGSDGEGLHVLLQHIGGDLMARTTFLPDAWRFRVVAADASGRAMIDGPHSLTCVAGPCCNSADVIAPRERLLPSRVGAGDLVAILDCGAYTHSSYMMYNVRAIPAIVGVEGLGAAAERIVASVGRTGEGRDGDAFQLRLLDEVDACDSDGALEGVVVRTLLKRRSETDVMALLHDDGM